MRDLRVQHYEQLEAYTLFDLLSILLDFATKYEQCEKDSYIYLRIVSTINGYT